jgi:hypothetical protein
MKEGLNSTAFQTVLSQIRAFNVNNTELVYVCTHELQNGTARFIVTDDFDQPTGSKYLDMYDTAHPESRVAIKQPTGVGPFTHRPLGDLYFGYRSG